MTSRTEFNWCYEGEYSGLFNLCDGRIVTDDGCSFDVHKVILAKCSSHFRALFCGMDGDKVEHRISNVTGNSMRDILNYIYTNDICVTEMNIKDLLVAADYFCLKDLKLKLSKYAKKMLTDRNCLKLCCTAYQINENDILQICFVYIERRFQIILERDDFIDFPKELLINILRRRNLNVDSERIVWKAIINWTQTGIQSRLKNLPSLLATLPIDEIGTDLATDIINHDIVFKNLHLKPLIDACTKSLNDFHSDGHLLITLLHKFSDEFPLMNSRIPQKLNIISKFIVEEDNSELYISYDETLDLWRKITKIKFMKPKYLAVTGWNVFMLDSVEGYVESFDLRTMKKNTMHEMQGLYDDPFLAIGHCIYRIDSSYGITSIRVFDTAINRWFSYRLLNNNLEEVRAVAIRENIFVVGVDEYNKTEVTALVFNSITRQHMFLARPTVVRCDFTLVAYHEKIFLISGCNSRDEEDQNVEVFSPAENLWKKLPPIPFASFPTFVNVFNDQLIAYILQPTEEESHLAARWNELKECWEMLEKSELVEDFQNYKTCTIDDAEIIHFLTKQNRKSEVQMEKSPFFFL